MNEVRNGPLGPEKTKEDGWTYMWPEEAHEVEVLDAEQPDFRYKRCGYRLQVEHYEEGIGWGSFGLLKNEADLVAEVELARAEPDPAL